MQDAMHRSDEILVDCQAVWKIFGSKAELAMRAIREQGLSKRDILQKFDCVVGVSGVDLQVRRGEIFCIMGLSGSGKSTLIRHLNRLISPTFGKILIKGTDLAALNASELRQMRAHHIGMVFQSVALLPHRTVLENAAFGLEVQGVPKEKRNETAMQALAKVGLSDWIKYFPEELSGGMQQRVGLARAIAADPEIILMDEPFSALDPLIRRQLQDEFRSLTKALGKSAVFITHDLDEAIRIGDRIAIMKDGVIIQVGTAEEIVQNPADGYVADFVAGISRLHLIRARTIMRPVAELAKARLRLALDSLPSTTGEATLNELIALAAETGADAIAIKEDGAAVGVITLRGLLDGIRGVDSEAVA